MARPAIPQRDPVGDPFSGVLLQVEKHYLLALTPQLDAEVVAEGDFVVRYGVRYLGKPHLSIVPGLVALDYGDMLTGEQALQFILRKSNLYPRADVVGYRNDGMDEMIVMKWLDLALPLEVLVYPDAGATVPLAGVAALIAAGDADVENAVPERTRRYLLRYDTVAEWLANRKEF
jgi:hypothetical protein